VSTLPDLKIHVKCHMMAYGYAVISELSLMASMPLLMYNWFPYNCHRFVTYSSSSVIFNRSKLIENSAHNKQNNQEKW
jgi:hypothetical protein